MTFGTKNLPRFKKKHWC